MRRYITSSDRRCSTLNAPAFSSVAWRTDVLWSQILTMRVDEMADGHETKCRANKSRTVHFKPKDVFMFSEADKRPLTEAEKKTCLAVRSETLHSQPKDVLMDSAANTRPLKQSRDRAGRDRRGRWDNVSIHRIRDAPSNLTDVWVTSEADKHPLIRNPDHAGRADRRERGGDCACHRIRDAPLRTSSWLVRWTIILWRKVLAMRAEETKERDAPHPASRYQQHRCTSSTQKGSYRPIRHLPLLPSI